MHRVTGELLQRRPPLIAFMWYLLASCSQGGGSSSREGAGGRREGRAGEEEEGGRPRPLHHPLTASLSEVVFSWEESSPVQAGPEQGGVCGGGGNGVVLGLGSGRPGWLGRG